MISRMQMKKIQLALMLLVSATVFTMQAAAQTGIYWEKDLDKAKARAVAENKPLLLHFYGNSCPPCQLMERDIFPNARVIEKLNADFVAVKIDTSRSPHLMNQYGVRQIPTDIFLSPSGEKLYERVGFGQVAVADFAVRFVAEMDAIAARFQKPQPTSANYSEGVAMSGNNTDQLQNANVTAQLQQLQAISALVPENPAVFQEIQTPSSMPLYVEPQSLESQIADVQQRMVNPLATLQPTVEPQYDVEPQFHEVPFQSPVFRASQNVFAAQDQWSTQYPVMPHAMSPSAMTPQNEPVPVLLQPYQPTMVANSTSVPPTVSVGSFDNGMVRKQPTPGLGAGTSLGVLAAVSDKSALGQMPTIALDGYCPVSLAHQAKWVKGNTEIVSEYDGVVYRFASIEAQHAFTVNPGLYAPVLRGNDAVELLTNRRGVAGQRKFGAWYHGRVFLFSNAENYEKFQNNPDGYAFQVEQSTNTLAASHTPIN